MMLGHTRRDGQTQKSKSLYDKKLKCVQCNGVGEAAEGAELQHLLRPHLGKVVSNFGVNLLIVPTQLSTNVVGGSVGACTRR